MYIPVDYSGSVYSIEALFDIGQLRGSRWKGSSVNGNKKDITGYALVAYQPQHSGFGENFFTCTVIYMICSGPCYGQTLFLTLKTSGKQ